MSLQTFNSEENISRILLYLMNILKISNQSTMGKLKKNAKNMY